MIKYKESMSPSEKTKYISNWIKSYVDQMPTRAESLVIGISGGIDSSVSSTLSAMTGIKTIVLSMPIKQKENQHDLSLKHQDWLVKKLWKAGFKGFLIGESIMKHKAPEEMLLKWNNCLK